MGEVRQVSVECKCGTSVTISINGERIIEVECGRCGEKGTINLNAIENVVSSEPIT